MQGVDRTRRIGQVLRKELAAIIARDVDSTSLGLVSITAVSVSRDLRHARVYVTALAPKVSQTEVMDQLNSQSATLRWALGQQAGLRRTPELFFEYDGSIERGTMMSKLIDDIEIPEDESAGN
ncbi:MAG TPA: 30S ribosome-binding factor RbfA [Gammaproteobacteria bacterium]|nr:30S ribosome-binding factor RbfA [Gammaproteobacteria bacterium]|tara:strand:+ start:243 stop:611 length:369 start_codon:yes stop_codon:yes gene_type:complete